LAGDTDGDGDTDTVDLTKAIINFTSAGTWDRQKDWLVAEDECDELVDAGT